MKQYKIRDIVNKKTGGTWKEGVQPRWIGRTVKEPNVFMDIGMVQGIKNQDGDEYEDYLYTSEVNDMIVHENGDVTIKTRNSIYEFEYLGDVHQ